MAVEMKSVDQRGRRSNRRRRLIVDKRFQYSLIRLLLAIWIVNLVLVSGILNFVYKGPLLRMDHLVNEVNLEIIPAEPPKLLATVGIAAVLGLALMGAVGVHLSHQIAGPLYRIKSSLKRISEGDLNFKIGFRKGDYLTEFPAYFNDMLRSLREQNAREVETLKSVEANLDEGSQVRVQLQQLREEKERRLGDGSSRDEESSEGLEKSRKSESLLALGSS
jgi:methyl-accepting chemotaxis protein